MAVISGDATDHALDVHAPAVERLARNVRRLADHCPVLMLQGTFSHEPPGTLTSSGCWAGAIRVHVADRIAQVALIVGRPLDRVRWLALRCRSPTGARALFSCVPTVNKAAVAAAVGAADAAEGVGRATWPRLLRGFAPINEAARAAGVPTIGVSHGTVFGCLTEHGVPMAGFDHEFTTGALFGAQAQAFLLGHIHRHQAWEQDGRMIAYAGLDRPLPLWRRRRQGIPDLGGRCGVGALRARSPPRRKRTRRDYLRGHAEIWTSFATQSRERATSTGAFVRVRWTVPEEDRHEVDRGAIERHPRRGRGSEARRAHRSGRAHARSGHLAGRHDRGQGAGWARATEARAEPLLACLEALQSHRRRQSQRMS